MTASGIRLRISSLGVEFQKGLRVGSWNPRLNVSGPMARGRIWFSDSFTGQYDQTVIDELPRRAGHGYRPFGTTTSSASRRISAHPARPNPGWPIWRRPGSVNRNGLGLLDRLQNDRGPAVAPVVRVRTRSGLSRRRGLIEFGVAVNRTFNRHDPAGHDLYVFTPLMDAREFLMNGTQDAGRDQFLTERLSPVLSACRNAPGESGVDLRPHQLWSGPQPHRLRVSRLQTDRPCGGSLYEGIGVLARSGYEASGYVQDAWRIRKTCSPRRGSGGTGTAWFGTGTPPRLVVAWSPRFFAIRRSPAGWESVTTRRTDAVHAAMDQYPSYISVPAVCPCMVPLRCPFLHVLG